MSQNTEIPKLSKADLFGQRKLWVRYAMTHGVRAATRHFSTSRSVIQKWLRRYQKDGHDGLRDRRHGPHHQKHKLSPEQEARIVQARTRSQHYGPMRLRMNCDIPHSCSTIARVLRDHHLIRKRRTRAKKRNDMRAVKAVLYAPAQHIQVDAKYLTDIPNLKILLEKDVKMPKFILTARDTISGWTCLGFTQDLTELNATIFVDHVLKHLKSLFPDRQDFIIQTDNGPEFSGLLRRPYAKQSFTKTVEDHGAQHRFIPPGCCNANADVESFHHIIENEFLDQEVFPSAEVFSEKLFSWLAYFNLVRLNSYKRWRSPWLILSEAYGDFVADSLSIYPVLDLDLASKDLRSSCPVSDLTDLAESAFCQS